MMDEFEVKEDCDSNVEITAGIPTSSVAMKFYPYSIKKSFFYQTEDGDTINLAEITNILEEISIIIRNISVLFLSGPQMMEASKLENRFIELTSISEKILGRKDD